MRNNDPNSIAILIRSEPEEIPPGKYTTLGNALKKLAEELERDMGALPEAKQATRRARRTTTTT